MIQSDTTTIAMQDGGFRQLLNSYLKPHWRRIIVLSFFLFTGLALQLAGPQVLRYFIDSARSGRGLRILILTAVIFLVIALFTQAFRVAETYAAENLGWIVTNRLRADLTLHCLELDMSFHNARTPGEFIERIDGDISLLANFFSRFMVNIVGSIVLFIGVLVLLFTIHPAVGITATLYGVISMAILLRLRSFAAPGWIEARQASAEMFGFLEERLSGTEDIRANGATSYVMRLFYKFARQLLRKEQKASMMGSATGSATRLLFALGTALLLGIGAYLFTVRELTLGTVYLVFYYTQLMNQPMQLLTRQLQDFQQAAASISRVQQLFRARPTILDGTVSTLPEGALEVEFRDVTFGYSSDEPVLRNINLRIAHGRTLGLIGRTGSGKTTATRLLFRLYEVNEGAVLIGGHNVRDLAIPELRRRVAIVTQDIQIFHASLRDNLTLFDPDIADDWIERVLDEIGLGEWYLGLPKGLDTKLAPGGTGLSAGEAQLLAFARVFLKDPGIVILDEASSRLDPSTERKIQSAVAKLMTNRTGIIIAHRLMTVREVDEIAVFEDGRIKEYGDRQTLERDRTSHFAHMLRFGIEESLA